MHAMPLLILVLAILAIAFRYYSAFLAAKVAGLDDSRPKPAPNTVMRIPEGAQISRRGADSLFDSDQRHYATLPPGTTVGYPNGAEVRRSEAFTIVQHGLLPSGLEGWSHPNEKGEIRLPS